MSPTDEQLQTLVERCEQVRDSKPPKGYRQGLALCIVDSVQSTGVTYSSVVNVVDSYRRYRKAQHADPETDGVRELSATFDELGGPDVWAREIGNQNKTSTHKGAPLKAAAIQDAVKVFLAEGITASQDLRDAAVDPERLAQIESAWLRIPGQRSGITWHYVQMLAGIDGVKPDRMIMRFVADTLGLSRRNVTSTFALEAVSATAAQMGMSPTHLDHGIWQWQRRRR